MDDIVRAALLKWPQVPHCHGWLGLDARGDWYMRDDATQHRGPFPQSRGSRIEHDRLIEFIGRNYEHDGTGAWFFQNGPQRVYVDLEAAPWVLRWPVDALRDSAVAEEVGFVTHTGRTTHAEGAWLDEAGRLFVQTPLGLGLVHTQDMHAVADAVEAGRLVPEDCRFEDLVRQAGLRRAPRP